MRIIIKNLNFISLQYPLTKYIIELMLREFIFRMLKLDQIMF